MIYVELMMRFKWKKLRMKEIEYIELMKLRIEEWNKREEEERKKEEEEE